ncbi:GNAT family N-acetyltransferase [Chitinimonas lacunae]|uniref:GNAT family N-acetyltransferase n=1 Tax=Chitinimonas lacunae TaxID=1963018 RepID=A0ABV8MML8_9NEIS
MSSLLPIDLPTQFETERLLVRSPLPGDGMALYEAICASLPQLRAWPTSLLWAQAEPCPQRAEQNCCEALAKWQRGEDLWMLIWDKQSGQLAGCSGLHQLNWAMRRGEIGWWGNTPLLGQGRIREAVRGVLDFAFSRCAMRRVSCVTHVDNLRSRHLAEQAGMLQEGVLRAWYPDGDAMLYGCVAP